MKKFFLIATLAVCPLPLLAVQIGDSLEKVIAEKGQPSNQLQAGANTILTYRDGSVKLTNHKVVAIKGTKELTEVNVKAAPPSAARPVRVIRAAPTATEAWSTDYEAALTQAGSEGKKVFLFFTGSDWCGWCKRLDGEILTTAAFKEYAAGNLILVKLDFPRSVAQPDLLKAQNNRLASKYAVRGFPTVIVLDSSGKAVGKLGYQEGGPAGFISRLQSL